MAGVEERPAVLGDSSDESGLDSSAPSIDLFLPHRHLAPDLSPTLVFIFYFFN